MSRKRRSRKKDRRQDRQRERQKQQTAADASTNLAADPEPIVRDTAYDSVKELTGQKFPFDADAPRDSRLAAQRRWQDWWDENRESF